MQRTDCDVAIIGGGPSGSTAAYVLAKAGYHATVIEKEHFPRFHVGESLLPFNRDLLARLDLADKVDDRAFLQKNGAHFMTYDGNCEHNLYFDAYFKDPHDYAWQVERSEWDELLLRHAQEAGADVREGHTVRRAVFKAGHNRLEVRDPDGNDHELTAKWVIDASGQSSFVAKQLGMRKPFDDLKKVALFSHYKGATRRDGREEGNIGLIFGDRCWFWYIPLRDNTVSIGCVTNRDRWESGTTAEQFMQQQIDNSPYIKKCVAGAERVRKVHTASAFSFQADQYVGDGWVLTGDSAAFLDPIFSTGVMIAMESGELAAQTLVKRLQAGGAIEPAHFRQYEKKLRKWTDTCFGVIRAFYHPSFASLFFNPKPRYQRAMAPFFAGDFNLGFKARLYFKFFFWVLKANARWDFVKDARPAESATYHG